MATVYRKTNTDSGLTGGTDFNKAILLPASDTTGTTVISVPANSTRDSFGYTDVGVPGTLGVTGEYVVGMGVVTAQNDIFTTCAVARVNSSGTQQAISAFATEQQATAGAHDFTFTAVNLGTWAAGDRLRITYRFRNNHAHASRDFTVEHGGVDNEVDAPWDTATAVSVNLTPATVASAAQAVSPQVAPIAVTLSSATINASAQTVSPQITPLSPVSVNLTPATVASTAQVVSPTPAVTAVALTPGTVASTAQVANPQIADPPVAITLTPGTTTASGQVLSPQIASDPVSVNLTPAMVTSSALPPGYYAIFRRTPQTGADFDPDVDIPIATTVQKQYVDVGVAQGFYDYQVFAWDGEAWSVGSEVVQVEVSAASPVVVTAAPATMAVAAQAVTPTLAPVAITAVPADLAGSGQVTTPVPAALAVSATQADLALAAQTTTPTLGAFAVSATPATAALAGQTVTLALAPTVIAATPVEFAVAGQAVTPVPAALAITAVPVDLVVAGQESDPVLAPFAVEVAPAGMALSAQIAAPQAAVLVTAAPAELGISAQAATPVFGARVIHAAVMGRDHYLDLPGSTGHYAWTPDHASVDITGDVDLRADAESDVWDSFEKGIIGKWNFAGGGQRSYLLTHLIGPELRLYHSPDGAAAPARTTENGSFAPSGRLQIRATIDVDNGSSQKVYSFYTREPPFDLADNSGWTLLLQEIIAGDTSLFSGTANIEVGSWNFGAGGPFIGKIYRALIMDGIAGTVVADFNANDFNAGDTENDTAVDSTGKTWTIEGFSTSIAFDADFSVTAQAVTPALAPLAIEATPIDLGLAAQVAAPQAATLVTAAPADLGLEAQAIDPTLAPVVVTATPVDLALAGQVTTPVPAALAVAAAPTELALAAQAATPAPAALAITAAPTALALSVQTVGAQAAVLITAAPADLAFQVQVAASTPAALAVSAVPADMGLSGQVTTPVPAALAVSAVQADLVLTSQAATPTFGPLVGSVTPATMALAAQAVTPTLAPVAISAVPADLAVAGQVTAPSPAALAVAGVPAELALAAQTATPMFAPIAVTAAPAEMAVTARVVQVTGGVVSVELVPATLGVSAQAGNSYSVPVTYMDFITTSGNATLADDPAFDLTDDAEWRVDFAPNDWTPGAIVSIAERMLFGDNNWRLRINNVGNLQIWLEDGIGGFRLVSTAFWTPPADGTRVQVRWQVDADNGSGDTAVSIYYRIGADIGNLESNDNWTLIQTNTHTGVQSWKATDRPIYLHGTLSGELEFVGKMFRAMQWSDLTKTTKVFDVEFTDDNKVNPLADAYQLLKAENYGGSGDWLDESGNGHDLTPVNGPTFNTDRWTLNSGATQYFGYPNNTDFDFAAADSFTYIFVATWDYDFSGGMTLWDNTQGFNATNPGVRIYETLTEGTLRCEIADGTVEGFAQSQSGALTQGVKHVMVVRRDTDADQLQVLVDGVAGTAQTDPTTGDLNGLTPRLGAHGASSTFNGDIYAVAIWDRALTDAEIAAASDLLTAGEDSSVWDDYARTQHWSMSGVEFTDWRYEGSGPKVISASPADLALSSEVTTPTPAALAVQADPADLNLDSQIVAPQAATAVSVSPVDMALTSQVTDPVFGALTVQADPTALTLASQVTDPTLAALAVETEPADLTLAPLATEPQAAVLISATPADLGLAAQVASTVPAALTVTIDPTDLTLAGQPTTPAPAPLSVSADPAELTLAGQVTTPQSAVAVTVSPVDLGLAAQATTPVFGALAVQAAPAELVTVSQASAPTFGAYSTEAVPAELVAAVQVVDPVFAALAVEADPVGLALAVQAIDPTLATLAVTATPASLALTGQATQPVLEAVAIEAAPATFALTAQGVNANGAIVIQVEPVALSFTGQATSPTYGAFSTEAVPAQLAVAGQEVAPTPNAYVVATEPVDLTLAGQATTPASASLAVEAAPATLQLDSQITAPQIPIVVTATPVDMALSAHAVVPSSGATVIGAEPADLALAGQPVVSTYGALTVLALPAVASLVPQVTSPQASMAPVVVSAAPVLFTVVSQVVTPTYAAVTVLLAPADLDSDAVASEPTFATFIFQAAPVDLELDAQQAVAAGAVIIVLTNADMAVLAVAVVPGLGSVLRMRVDTEEILQPQSTSQRNPAVTSSEYDSSQNATVEGTL